MSLFIALSLTIVVPRALAAEIVAVCFTPGGDCTGLLVDQIGTARRQVLVQAYSFTSPEVVEALADAKRRGVDVRVILDKSNTCKDGGVCEKKGALAAEALTGAGVPVLIDRIHGIAHNKVMIIDGIRVITGSFNFTKAAQERNAENLLVIGDQDLARRYAANWWERVQNSD
jgi:phosphatidylserine/phosphatidylglycerophosphate/cardiolipin synthase-like enzyme